MARIKDIVGIIFSKSKMEESKSTVVIIYMKSMDHVSKDIVGTTSMK